MKNNVDAVKNDFARAKAEWERERKKLTGERDEDSIKLREQLELEMGKEIKEAKERNDKLLKKKLQDKEE